MTAISTILLVEKLVTLAITAGVALDSLVPIFQRLISDEQITQAELDAIIAAAAVSDQRFDDLLERISD